MDLIGKAIDSYFARKKKLNYWQVKIYSEYDKIVGKSISSNTKIIWIHGSTVTIACRNSVWMNELRNLQDKIIEKINKKIGKIIIEELIFKIGNIENVIQKKAMKKSIVLNKEDEKWIIETKMIVPADLRDRFESLLRAFKELKKV